MYFIISTTIIIYFIISTTIIIYFGTTSFPAAPSANNSTPSPLMFPYTYLYAVVGVPLIGSYNAFIFHKNVSDIVRFFVRISVNVPKIKYYTVSVNFFAISLTIFPEFSFRFYRFRVSQFF